MKAKHELMVPGGYSVGEYSCDQCVRDPFKRTTFLTHEAFTVYRGEIQWTASNPTPIPSPLPQTPHPHPTKAGNQKKQRIIAVWSLTHDEHTKRNMSCLMAPKMLTVCIARMEGLSIVQALQALMDYTWVVYLCATIVCMMDSTVVIKFY